jgi:hypothetical protein
VCISVVYLDVLFDLTLRPKAATSRLEEENFKLQDARQLCVVQHAAPPAPMQPLRIFVALPPCASCLMFSRWAQIHCPQAALRKAC